LLVEEPRSLLASLRESSRRELLFHREAGLSAYPPPGLLALPFFRERCTMFTFIAAAAILAAVTGGVVAAIRRSHRNKACIDARLRAYCAR
jgi:hypothetical protein